MCLPFAFLDFFQPMLSAWGAALRFQSRGNFGVYFGFSDFLVR